MSLSQPNLTGLRAHGTLFRVLKPGQTFGNYRIIEQIGVGGMGAVYLAEHPLIGKQVALKVIHSELSANKEVITRFFNEARAANQIGNEHIVNINDFGQTDDGKYFYIMELLEGRTLAQTLVTTRVIRPVRALHISAQLALGLAAAHRAGIIHRDLKPDNIMIVNRQGDADFVKILDFGLAKVLDSQKQLTAIGVVLGTPQYMSPEACESKRDIDRRSDIYSVGILMFQMLCGRVPFQGESMGEVLIKQVTQLPPSLRAVNPAVPVAIEQIVLRCLAKNRDHRFDTMTALRSALLDPAKFLASSPVSALSSGSDQSMTMGVDGSRRATVAFAGVSPGAARRPVEPTAPPPRPDQVGTNEATGKIPSLIRTLPPQNQAELVPSTEGVSVPQAHVAKTLYETVPPPQPFSQLKSVSPTPDRRVPISSSPDARTAFFDRDEARVVSPMSAQSGGEEHMGNPGAHSASSTAQTAFLEGPILSDAAMASTPAMSHIGSAQAATQYMDGANVGGHAPPIPNSLDSPHKPNQPQATLVLDPPVPLVPTEVGAAKGPKRSLMWIGLTTLAALSCFTVLGFVWPGFFVSSLEDAAVPRTGAGRSGTDAGPKGVITTTTSDLDASPVGVSPVPGIAEPPVAAADEIDAGVEMVVVTLESKPPAATVTDGSGKVVGKTPMSISLERGNTKVIFRLTHPRAKPRKTSVVPDNDKRLVVELVLKRRGRKIPKPGKSTNRDNTLKPFD